MFRFLSLVLMTPIIVFVTHVHAVQSKDAHAQQTDTGNYVIRLGDSHFVPTPHSLKNNVAQAQAFLDSQVAQRKASHVHVLIQFYQAIENRKKTELSKLGVVLLQPIARTTWRVAVSQKGWDVILNDDAVRWAQLPTVEQKAVKRVLTGNNYEYQKQADGSNEYIVTAYPDVTQAALQRAVKESGGRVVQDQQYGTTQSVTAHLLHEGLMALLKRDVVAWIEAGHPPQSERLVNASSMSNVHSVQRPPINLNGLDVTIGIWDGGRVDDHADFDTRLRIGDGAALTSDHPTLVAGVAAGSGAGNSNAKGMAPLADIFSFDLANDLAEMRRQSSAGSVDISNHSYGPVIGWYRAECRSVQFLDNQDLFGAYTDLSRNLDQLVNDTQLVIVQAAGNDAQRLDTDPSAGPPDDCLRIHSRDSHCLGPRSSAKNLVTVGSVGFSGDRRRAPYSSVGPTSDGRIKPDLMADGGPLTTTNADLFTDTNCDEIDDAAGAYDTAAGTSMASPIVTGIGALVIEQARKVSLDLKAASVKALLIASSSQRAPSYKSGWGIVDAHKAVGFLRHYDGPCLIENRVGSSATNREKTHTFTVHRGQQLAQVTLVWSDPAAAAGRTNALVNDLDLVLIDPAGVEHRPWLLNPDSPHAAARRAGVGETDTLNNVERVSVERPIAGEWTVRVTGTDVSSTTQIYSLVGACPVPDVDRDGITNNIDNCPNTSNRLQLDTDRDSIGDRCDDDIDNDGYANGEDRCPLTVDPTPAVDTDRDGIWDSCDIDDDNDCVVDQSDNCPLVRNCNYFGSAATPRVCSDPCQPTGSVHVVPRVIVGLCARGPLLPKCFADGCPWPSFFDTPFGNARDLLGNFLERFPFSFAGIKLIEKNAVRLSEKADGLILNRQHVIDTLLKHPTFEADLSRILDIIANLPSNNQMTSSSVFSMPNDSRFGLCSIVMGRYSVSEPGEVLAEYRACVDDHREDALACQLDLNDNDIGDACE